MIEMAADGGPQASASFALRECRSLPLAAGAPRSLNKGRGGLRCEGAEANHEPMGVPKPIFLRWIISAGSKGSTAFLRRYFVTPFRSLNDAATCARSSPPPSRERLRTSRPCSMLARSTLGRMPSVDRSRCKTGGCDPRDSTDGNSPKSRCFEYKSSGRWAHRRVRRFLLARGRRARWDSNIVRGSWHRAGRV